MCDSSHEGDAAPRAPRHELTMTVALLYGYVQLLQRELDKAEPARPRLCMFVDQALTEVAYLSRLLAQEARDSDRGSRKATP